MHIDRKFPTSRLRRLRANNTLINLVSESSLSSNDLIQPLFIKENLKGTEKIDSMPGVLRYSKESVIDEVEDLLENNINTIALVPGSGTQFLQEILGKVDLFITGDVSHHHFLLADEYEMGIMQLNHISTEKPGMKIFTEKLNKTLKTEIEYLYNEYYE